MNGGLWHTCLWMVAPSIDLEKKTLLQLAGFPSVVKTLNSDRGTFSHLFASLLLLCLLPLQDNNHLGSQLLFCP